MGKDQGKKICNDCCQGGNNNKKQNKVVIFLCRFKSVARHKPVTISDIKIPV
jgi:hypothetical protein